MDPDDLQKAWQSQDVASQIPSDEETLRMVLTRSRKIERSIFWRDVRESVVAIVMAPVLVWMGYALNLHIWPEYAAAALCLWIAAFLFIDHRRQREPKPGLTATESIEQALRKVNHQIRLLRNVAWWYLTPCALGILLLVGDAVSQIPIEKRSSHYGVVAGYLLFVVVLYTGIYWVNQYAARKTLHPLKEELEQALQELKSGT